MASEWVTVQVKDIGRVVTGRTPPGTDQEYFGSEVPFITPTDMDGRRVVDRPLRYLSLKGTVVLRSVLVPKGVAVSCIGWQMGKAVLVDRLSATNQQIHTIVSDERTVDTLFLYYSMVARREEIFRLGAGGSRTPILNKSGFERLVLLLPPLVEQRAISRVLGSLDDKIDLNRRMNETLEVMARAIFKSWFVDFDPVRAKAEGRQPAGMDAETAALFPDSCEGSALGKIPHGWIAGELGEVAEIIDCLHAKKPERQAGGNPLLQVWNIRDDGLLDMRDTYWITEDAYRLWTSRIEARQGDIVLTNVGRVGAAGQVSPGLRVALGRNMTAVRCHESFPFPTFIIQCLLSQTMKDEIAMKTDTGTVLDSLNVRNIPKLRLVRPPAQIAHLFESTCRPLRARMEHNLTENRSLIGIRDALLPKLLSGEVSARDAERLVTEVGV